MSNQPTTQVVPAPWQTSAPNPDIHEAANLLPMMSQEELRRLSDDIRGCGLTNPIMLLDGKVIDGRNRLIACQEAGVDPRFVKVDVVDNPTTFVLSLNLHRRHLSTTQKSMIAARLRKVYEKEAKERQGRRTDIKENLPECSGQARDKAGETVGVSGKSVDSATKVLESGVKELQNACDRGEVSIAPAAVVSQLPAAQQQEIVERGLSTGELKAAISSAAQAVKTNREKACAGSVSGQASNQENGTTAGASKSHLQASGAKRSTPPKSTTEVDSQEPEGDPVRVRAKQWIEKSHRPLIRHLGNLRAGRKFDDAIEAIRKFAADASPHK